MPIKRYNRHICLDLSSFRKDLVDMQLQAQGKRRRREERQVRRSRSQHCLVRKPACQVPRKYTRQSHPPVPERLVWPLPAR
ncbi:hypothetical protein KC367_g180 [Hortaea werneckii]|nr:hypothetical protein KC367_g180 [Hortaea werneckii]